MKTATIDFLSYDEPKAGRLNIKNGKLLHHFYDLFPTVEHYQELSLSELSPE